MADRLTPLSVWRRGLQGTSHGRHEPLRARSCAPCRHRGGVDPRAIRAPAGAATPCAERVIADWSDNGRIDGVYALECYEAAIDAIPVDLRDYTNAADVIARALTVASRQDRAERRRPVRALRPLEAVPAADTSSASSVPLPLILVVVVSVLVLAAGLGGPPHAAPPRLASGRACCGLSRGRATPARYTSEVVSTSENTCKLRKNLTVRPSSYSPWSARTTLVVHRAGEA